MGARKLLIAFMVIVVLVSSASAEAGQEPIEIVVTGYAVIQEDLAHALDVAIRDAMRRGVEQALGSYLDSHTWVSNFDLVEDSILSKATGYISSYSIKDQWVDEGLINVVLLMIIQEGRLENDVNALKVAIQRKGNPRIAVLIPQQSGSSLLASSPAEPIIIEGLISAGFLVVNNRPLSYDYYSSEVSRALAGDTQAIIHLADVLNAELLVLGVAKASPVGNIHGLESYRGNVEVRIIDVSSSYLLATHSTNEPGLGLNTEDAARVAISNAGTSMIDDLVTALANRYVNKETSISLEINGLAFEEVQMVETRLKNTHLVENVFIRGFRDGQAQLDVSTLLTTIQLAHEIQAWSGLYLEVIGVSGNSIEVVKVNAMDR